MSAFAEQRLTAREWSEWLRGPWSWLYFIQAGENGPVKIGVAKDTAERLRTLQQGNVETLHLRAARYLPNLFERLLHERFAADRIRGEWFAPSLGVLATMEEYAREAALDEAAVLRLPPAGWNA